MKEFIENVKKSISKELERQNLGEPIEGIPTAPLPPEIEKIVQKKLEELGKELKTQGWL